MAAPRTTSEAKLEEDENPSKKRKISPAVEVSVIKASSSSPLRPPVLRAPKITPFTSGRPCRSVDNFERLNKIEEGTYGVVYRARDKGTGEIVALKRVKMEQEKEGFPLTSLREFKLLMCLRHENIVNVKEIVIGKNSSRIFIVMEFLPHDMKVFMGGMKERFSASEVKCLLLQLLKGVAYLHDNWVIHRDLKCSNLLLSSKGILKIADMGLARDYGSPLKEYTSLVVTLWYRAPELLLGAKKYRCEPDMWSVGCIFAEFLMSKPLLPGKNELEQILKIFQLLGTPSEKIWPDIMTLPHASKVNFIPQPFNNLRQKFPSTFLTDAGFDLLNQLLTYDPKKRITAHDAINHPYFKEHPLPKDPSMLPSCPSKAEGKSRKKKESPGEVFRGGNEQRFLDQPEVSYNYHKAFVLK